MAIGRMAAGGTIGLTRHFISEQHQQLRDLATRVAIEVSGDQGLRQDQVCRSVFPEGLRRLESQPKASHL